jgi:hypothetical protein
VAQRVPRGTGLRLDRVWGVRGCSCEAEERQGAGGTAADPAQRGGDAGVTGQAEQPDRKVAQGGHDLGAGRGADAAGVLGEDDVADPVQRFDLPVRTDQGAQLRRAGGQGGLAAERVDDLGARVAAGKVGGVPLEDDDLLGVGEAQAGWGGRGPGRAMFDAAVAAVNGLIRRGKTPARRAGRSR